MTPRQREALDFITGYCRAHGFSPSFEEICAALGLKSKSGASQLIEGLEAGGHIVRNKYRARSVFPAEMVEASVAREAADAITGIISAHDLGSLSAKDALDHIRPVVANLAKIT